MTDARVLCDREDESPTYILGRAEKNYGLSFFMLHPRDVRTQLNTTVLRSF